MRSPREKPVRSEFLGPYNHRIYVKNMLRDDKGNPAPPSSPNLERGGSRVLTSRWLSPWSSRTSCGRRSADPSETRRPCRGSLQRASGPALLRGNTRQRAPSLSTTSHKITTLCASWPVPSPPISTRQNHFQILNPILNACSYLGHTLSPLWR